MDYSERLKSLKYSVIVGSYKNEENAINHMNSTKTQYADVQLLPATPDGLYRVSVGDFLYSKKGEALELRNEAREEGTDDAWLLLTNK
jgi:hypothetical protein